MSAPVSVIGRDGDSPDPHCEKTSAGTVPASGSAPISTEEETGFWFELAVSCGADAVEIVAALFAEHGFNEGVLIEASFTAADDAGNAIINPSLPVTVYTYLPAETADPIVDLIRESLPRLQREHEISDLVIREIRITRRADEDWPDAWHAYGNLIHVGRSILVKAPWLEHEARPGEIVLELETGISFGTGGHPSTDLVMSGIEDVLAPGMRVLDVGTGTGILAIASARLGATTVDAVDIEPDAIRVTRANAARNGVGDIVHVELGSVGADQPFQGEYDLVVANILGPILLALAEDLVRAVQPGGFLILGGIIDFREVSVRDAFEALGMRLCRRQEAVGWVMLVLRKPRDRSRLDQSIDARAEATAA